MPLTAEQTCITIVALALGMVLTRFLPFILFPDSKEPPTLILYLGRVLPPTMMGLLVVYCFKSTSVLSAPYAVPELISVACIIVLHLWKRNVLLSIGAGTGLYMLLMQGVIYTH